MLANKLKVFQETMISENQTIHDRQLLEGALLVNEIIDLAK